MVFTSVKYYSSIKNGHESFVRQWMYLKTTMLSEINQPHKLTYCMVSLIREAHIINVRQIIGSREIKDLSQMERDRGREGEEKEMVC